MALGTSVLKYLVLGASGFLSKAHQDERPPPRRDAQPRALGGHSVGVGRMPFVASRARLTWRSPEVWAAGIGAGFIHYMLYNMYFPTRIMYCRPHTIDHEFCGSGLANFLGRLIPSADAAPYLNNKMNNNVRATYHDILIPIRHMDQISI